MTYAEVKAALLAYLGNPAYEQFVDTFMRLAEARLNRVLRDRQMSERTSYEDFSTETIPLPDDFEAFVSAWYADKAPLQYVPVDQMADYWHIGSTSQGKPRYFTITGDVLAFSPIPNGDYSIILRYRQRVPALTASNTTNWVSLRHPDLYIYACCEQAALFLSDEDAAWSQKANAMRDRLDRALDEAERAAVANPLGAVLTPIVTGVV